jgi:tellurite methyltransferase
LERLFDEVTLISYDFEVTLSLIQSLLMITFLANPTLVFAGHAHVGDGTGDAATYEAITGDSLDDDRAVWDSFYKSKNNAFGKEAVGFLKDNLHFVKPGLAFVPAMGEGRNAIYIAKKGFTVDGNDLSEVAVDHAIEEAKNQHITIRGIVADLNEYHYLENHYDFVVVSLFYIPTLIPKFKKSLKRGGYILFYEKLDTGKNAASVSPDDFIVKADELKAMLKDFKIQVIKQYKDHNVDVIGVLARKP